VVMMMRPVIQVGLMEQRMAREVFIRAATLTPEQQKSALNRSSVRKSVASNASKKSAASKKTNASRKNAASKNNNASRKNAASKKKNSASKKNASKKKHPSQRRSL
jgi:hypothetical protein